MAYQQMTPGVLAYRRQEFEDEARQRRQNIFGRVNEVCADLGSRWQQWSEESRERFYNSVTWTKISDPHRKHARGSLWWNKGKPQRQATLALKNGDTNMNKMFAAPGTIR